MDGREFITYEEAVAMLPAGEFIHAIAGGSYMLGMECKREEILSLLRAGRPEIAGDVATSIGHGLAVRREDDIMLFIETAE